MSFFLRIALSIAAMLYATAGYAQQPDHLTAVLKERQRLFNSKYLGMPLPQFSATAWDGRKMNNAAMKGSVYLLAIFYPDCRCYHPEALKKLVALEGSRRDFHMVAMLQDTAYLYAYRADHAEPLHYAVTDTREQLVDLRMELSPPLYVLVDRNGIVVKVLDTKAINALNGSDEEQDELVKRVQELLLF